jgi:hypothetical protein
MLTDASFHRRSDPQRLMHARKVVVHMEQGDHRNVVLNLLAEGIRQASEAPHIHPHVEVLSLHVACRDVRVIGIADEVDFGILIWPSSAFCFGPPSNERVL